MKKIALVLMVVSLVFASSSCKKDKDDPTFTKSQLIGKWKQTSPASETGVTDYISFTDTEYISSTAVDGVETKDAGVAYTFDGKTVAMGSGLTSVTLTINSLSTTTLVVSETWMGQSLGQATYTKVP